MILSMIFVAIQVPIYAPEVAAPGVYNTMECLWGLSGLHPMQLFQSLQSVRLLSGFLVHLSVIGNAIMG